MPNAKVRIEIPLGFLFVVGVNLLTKNAPLHSLG